MFSLCTYVAAAAAAVRLLGQPPKAQVGDGERGRRKPLEGARGKGGREREERERDRGGGGVALWKKKRKEEEEEETPPKEEEEEQTGLKGKEIEVEGNPNIGLNSAQKRSKECAGQGGNQSEVPFEIGAAIFVGRLE